MGAKRINNRRDIDLEDWNSINGWMAGTTIATVTLTNSITHITAAVCKKLAALEVNGVRGDYLWEKKQAGELLQIERIGTKKRPLYAAVKAKRLLTVMVGELEEKETFHLEFSLGEQEPLTYLPGDSLAVYAQNCPGKANASYLFRIITQLTAFVVRVGVACFASAAGNRIGGSGSSYSPLHRRAAH